ncbi:MAG: inorganic phosphate transporter [Candidatus Nanopelagicales bacterium]|jgi:PiT family inorganic phosphate transporter
MDAALIATIVVVVIAVGFDFTNGFHDAANAIATSVGTRALTPTVALGLAAVFNFIGAFIGYWTGSGVAKTIQSVTTPASGFAGLALIAAALGGAIGWNLITWRLGLPSSSTHALIGGVVGAALAAGTVVAWSTVWDKVVIPMVTSPFVGLILAFLLMRLIVAIFRDRNPQKVGGGFRHAQTVSAAAMAMGHGMQDAQKTMGVIFLLMVTMGYASASEEMPVWIVIACATAISLGTAVGGKRIMKTLGRRIIDLDPARGFSAESTSAAVLYVTALGLEAPVSTTQVITGGIMGAGVEKRVSSVRWSVGVNILWAWVLTLPAAAAIAAVVYLILKLVTPL